MDVIPVRTNTLRPETKLLFEVFVHFSGQYVKYKGVSETFEVERLSRFMNKGIKKVFIKREDEPHYLDYLDSALDQLAQADINAEDKAAFAKDTIMSEAENVEKNLDTQQGYTKAQNRIDKVVKFLSTETGALKMMLSSAGVSVDNSQHSATVASLSLALAPRIGANDQDDLQALGFAALLHDIGKAKLGIDANLHPSQMDKEQIKLYHRHPEVAVEMLSGKKFITPKVLRMIVEHEEIGDGNGFPEKKKLKKLPLPSQALNLCNDFDRFAKSLQKSTMDVFGEFMEQRGDFFEFKHLEMLEKIVNGMV